ncbi:MAG: FG-GAP repeat domain-containing protein [Planctomycetota bacterium]
MSWRLLGPIALFLALSSASRAQEPNPDPRKSSGRGTASVEDSAASAWRLDAAQSAIACQERADGDYELVVGAPGGAARRLPAERWELLRFQPGDRAAADLDGDGAPEVVVAGWEGRRCRLWTIAGGQARPLPGWHARGARLEDRDGDGAAELVTHDETFVGWRGWSAADSPGVEVVLQRVARGGLWRVAPALLGVRRPDPRALRLAARALARACAAPSLAASTLPAAVAREPASAAPQATVRSRTAAAPASAEQASGQDGELEARHRFDRALTQALLDLHAAGQGELAPAFLAAAWPTDRSGREAFWRHFQARLRLSPYLGLGLARER